MCRQAQAFRALRGAVGRSPELHHTVALCLLIGQGLIISAVNEAWLRLCGGSASIGVPLGEAYIDPQWAPFQAAVRGVLNSGLARTVYMPSGQRLGVVPLTVRDGRPAVVLRLDPVPVPIRAPRPARPLTAAPIAPAA